MVFLLASLGSTPGEATSSIPHGIVDVYTTDVERFLTLLEHPLPSRRTEGLQGLSHLKCWEAEDRILVCLSDDSEAVRRAAVDALARLGTAQSVPSLIALLEDPVWDIRQSAWLVLCRMTAHTLPSGQKAPWESWWRATSRSEREQSLLRTARGTPSESDAPSSTRRAALRALRHLAASTAEPALLELLAKSQQPSLDREERAWIIEALERVGSPKAVPVLAGQRLEAAAWALGRLGGPAAIPALLKNRPSLPVLLALDRLHFTNAGPHIPFLVDQMGLVTYRSQPDDVMNPEDQPAQRVASNLIRRSGLAPLLIELVIQELEDSMEPPIAHSPRPAAPPNWIPMLVQMREELKPGFVRNDGHTTSQPLTAMSHLAEDPALVPRLLPLLRHPAFVARIYVAFALGRLRASEALPDILSLIREGYTFSDATAQASGKHFDRSQTVRWRGFLCMALGRMGGKEARLALETLAADASQPRDIRYSSVIGLRFIGAKESVAALRQVAGRDIIWMVRQQVREVADAIELSQEGRFP